MQRNNKLIKLKFYNYLLPGIMMVAALQLGNLIDAIFVANFLGTDALAAMNLGMPVVFIAQIPFLMVSVGGSIVSGIHIGKHQYKKASNIFCLLLFLVFVFNITNAIASCFYSKPLAEILSAHSFLEEMTYQHIFVHVLGMPIIGIGYIASSFMGVDNHPYVSSLFLIIASVVNLSMDFIYIKVFNMGVSGAALATVTGFGAATIVSLIIYTKSKKRTLKFSFRTMFEDSNLLIDAIKDGMSSGAMYILNSIKILILNAFVLTMTGEIGLALYTVCIQSFFIVKLCLNGIPGVIQTTVGVLYGEKDYYGIRTILKNSIVLSCIVVFIVMMVFICAPWLIEIMFGFDIIEYKETMDITLRIYALSFLGYSLNNIAQVYYSTIEKPFYATLDAVLQGFILLVPFSFWFLTIWGVIGTSIASVITEIVTLLVITFVRKYAQSKGRLEGNTFDMLPEKQNMRFVDITVENNIRDAVIVSHKFKEYCLEEGIDSKTSNIIALAGEELIRSITNMNNSKKIYIDICLVKEYNNIVLRVRDNGLLFNPFKECQSEIVDIENINQIQILYKLAKSVDYARVLNMNNTIVLV